MARITDAATARNNFSMVEFLCDVAQWHFPHRF